ncbi:DUF6508 domain-containing protein [Streptacidiphilus sp. MAP12-33]|uniref:DUF6508 domain-containing protein n=1 Tax=Streptacidiphilus sp. MAP12-33 TaxID=3156266 RepID=UPI003518FA1B
MRRLLHPDASSPLPTGGGEAGDPGDAALLAGLDRGAAAWGRLGEFAAGWAVQPGDAEWDGRHPVYGPRVQSVTDALAAVGAVTPAYDWNAYAYPPLAPDGSLTAADAVRTATAVLRGERFTAGTLLAAWKNGRLNATVRALTLWYETGEE